MESYFPHYGNQCATEHGTNLKPDEPIFLYNQNRRAMAPAPNFWHIGLAHGVNLESDMASSSVRTYGHICEPKGGQNANPNLAETVIACAPPRDQTPTNTSFCGAGGLTIPEDMCHQRPPPSAGQPCHMLLQSLVDTMKNNVGLKVDFLMRVAYRCQTHHRPRAPVDSKF